MCHTGINLVVFMCLLINRLCDVVKSALQFLWLFLRVSHTKSKQHKHKHTFVDSDAPSLIQYEQICIYIYTHNTQRHQQSVSHHHQISFLFITNRIQTVDRQQQFFPLNIQQQQQQYQQHVRGYREFSSRQSIGRLH